MSLGMITSATQTVPHRSLVGADIPIPPPRGDATHGLSSANGRTARDKTRSTCATQRGRAAGCVRKDRGSNQALSYTEQGETWPQRELGYDKRKPKANQAINSDLIHSHRQPHLNRVGK